MNYRFLIYISHTYALPIGAPLQKEILRQGHDVKWFSELDPPKTFFPEHGVLLNDVDSMIEYEPHIVLSITNEVADFISGLKVQVFHGFLAKKRPSKKHIFSEFNIRGFFDLYCTQGPSTTSVFKKLEKKYKHFKVVETGWSKVDPLFPIEEKQKGIKPTIMIASTFTERLSLAYNEDVYEEIKRLSENESFNFKMVLHPKIPSNIVVKWKSLENKNFTFYDTTDLIPIFKKCDALFADTTSTIQEFLLQKKPVVAFNHTFSYDYLINVHEVKNIESALKQSLNPSTALLDNIEKFILELHPYFDGKSSERVIAASIEVLHQDNSNLKSKPLNLIRKLKLRKRLHYFTLKTYLQKSAIKK